MDTQALPLPVFETQLHAQSRNFLCQKELDDLHGPSNPRHSVSLKISEKSISPGKLPVGQTVLWCVVNLLFKQDSFSAKM